MLDQIAALAWVRDNIAAFGGDASNVTIFGESAGGMSIGALLAMPDAAGLFQRAILESGAAHHAISAESARLVATRVADIVGAAHSREALAAVPIEKLLAAQAQVAGEVSTKPLKKLWGDVAANGLPFEPVIDGQTLHSLPIDAVRAGASADVDILVGNNAEEAMLIFAPAGNLDAVKSWLLYAAAARVKLPFLRGPRAYRAARPTARTVDHISDMMTDWLYRIPAVRLAEAHPGSFVYEFAWRSPAFDNELGACHGVELPFVFDQLAASDWKMLTGGTAPQAVADAVHTAWVRFATTGNPGWDAYRPGVRTVMRFDTQSGVVIDPAAATRELWNGRR
jgi:para-nitrobenzyl esterase